MKTKGKISRKPKAASVDKDFKKVGGKAWWYENAGSIDVIISTGFQPGPYSCRIRRSQLADWIKRSEPKQ